MKAPWDGLTPRTLGGERAAVRVGVKVIPLSEALECVRCWTDRGAPASTACVSPLTFSRERDETDGDHGTARDGSLAILLKDGEVLRP
jgi:hypothetical protein